MKRPLAQMKALAALTLALALPAHPAVGQTSGASTVLERRISAAEPPPVAEFFQAVLEFEPGAWTALHSHNGPSYNTVLEGEITLRMGGVDRTFAAGEGWVDEPCTPHVAGNQGTTPARLVASFVVSRGIPPSTFLEPDGRGTPPPEPTSLAMHKMGALAPARSMEVIHRVIDLEPGSTVAMQARSGPTIVSVLAGDVSVETDGVTHTFRASNSWAEPAGLVHGYTAGGAPTRLVSTTFAARGVPAQ